ncbi:MAG: hypothetical protein RL308_1759 [Bacteroidota bacterium]|jgi:type I restriction enzyme S subunit
MEKIKNIPSLRFPEFDGEWEVKRLGEVADISSGGTPSRINQNYWNGDIPWVSTSLIDFNKIDETTEYITKEGLKNSSAKLFPIGTLLMAMYGQGKTRGKIAILNIEASTNQACGAIITNSNRLNSLFAFQNLSKRYDEIRDLSNQGGQENLSGGILKGIEIAFPTLPEQQKIASFLTTVDDKLQALKQKKTLLEQYKKGVMQQIFSQELRFKDDNENDYPDWEEKKLSDIGKFISGTGFTDKEQGGLKGIPFLKVSDMNLPENKIVIKTSNNFVSEEQVKRMKYNVIKTESLIFAKVGAAIFLERKRIAKNYLIDNNMMAFIPSGNVLFFYHLFNNIRLSKYAQVGALPSYNSSDLGIIKTSIPSITEQTKIANFLSAIDDKINHCQEQIGKTEVWKKGLLQNMFV